VVAAVHRLLVGGLGLVVAATGCAGLGVGGDDDAAPVAATVLAGADGSTDDGEPGSAGDDTPSTTGPSALSPADVELDTEGCRTDPTVEGGLADGPIRIGVNGGGFNFSRHLEGLQVAIDDANARGGSAGVFDEVHRLRLFPAPPADLAGTNYDAAVATGWAVVAVIEAAARAEGGPTRANITSAALALSTEVAVGELAAGGGPERIVLRTADDDDRFPLESGLIEVYRADRPDGGEPGWQLVSGEPVEAEGLTPFAIIDWTEPVIVEEDERSRCPSGFEPELLTSHWFGENGRLDPLADIVLQVRNVDLGPDPGATLMAMGADGTRLELAMTLGRGGSACAGEVFFDVVRGEPARINDLTQPVAVTFELTGGGVTRPVTWPDDFPLAPPFGNVRLDLE
jgi:hypothetical protein